MYKNILVSIVNDLVLYKLYLRPNHPNIYNMRSFYELRILRIKNG